MPDYAHPEVLVDTQWLLEHLQDPTVRVSCLTFKVHTPLVFSLGRGFANDFAQPTRLSEVEYVI
jgi:hypothetical protein